MFFAGDEFCNTQFGNNNSYCQDNITSWLDWNRLEEYKEIHDFFRYMIRLRKDKDVYKRQAAQYGIVFSDVMGGLRRCLADYGLLDVYKRQEEKRMIRIYMDMKNTQLYMSFTNFTATKKQKKISGRFHTTKGQGHGFGLVRIDDIVERYGGYLSRNSEDGAFTTEILLPQE